MLCRESKWETLLLIGAGDKGSGGGRSGRVTVACGGRADEDYIVM